MRKATISFHPVTTELAHRRSAPCAIRYRGYYLRLGPHEVSYPSITLVLNNLFYYCLFFISDSLKLHMAL